MPTGKRSDGRRRGLLAVVPAGCLSFAKVDLIDSSRAGHHGYVATSPFYFTKRSGLSRGSIIVRETAIPSRDQPARCPVLADAAIPALDARTGRTARMTTPPT